MSAVPLKNDKPAQAGVRTVTILGATGSIGNSTMDLLRGARGRYRVEALTANSNVEVLVKLAREFDARFVAVADTSRFGELKDALAGSDIQTNPPATNEAVDKLNKTYTKQVDKLPSKEIVDEIHAKVDPAKLEAKLMEEGTAKFADPQHALLKLIAEKRASLATAK